MTFQFTLLTDTPYSPLPRELQHQVVASSPSSQSSSSHRISDWSDSCRRTIVAVEVQDSQNGAVHYWSLIKLRQRLELMREMCRSEAEKSPTQSSPGSTSTGAALNQSADNSTISGNDPFYDLFPWFRLVGRAFVLLGSLLYPVPLVHNVPIVNEKGDVRGYLRVAVQAVIDDENGDYSSGVKQSARISFADSFREKSQVFSNYSESPPGRQQMPMEEEEEDGQRVVEGHGRGGDSSGSESNQDDQSKADEEKDKESIIADHLTPGKDFTFRITILHALNIPLEYSDIFCQFHFAHHQDEAFSTEPIRNNSANRGANNIGAPLSFYHVQNITVKVTKSFVDYLRTQPLVLEVYGHLQQTLCRDRANPVAMQSNNRLPPKRMLPPLLPVSQPLRSTKFGMLPPSPTSQVDAKHDLLVWVEILELASSGEYLPVMVERNPDLPCRSEFILRQGLQRRIRITLVHEFSDDLNWGDVRELVVGRIRTGAECENGDEIYENDMSVVSLGLFPGEVLEFPGDTRHFYRFEAAWDSSLHNSILLNRVTPSGEHIYLTMSAYVQLDNCEQLSVITKDLCVTILGRDARTGTRSLKVNSTLSHFKK